MSNMKQGVKEGLGVQDKKKTSCETCLVKKRNIPQDKLSWVPKHDFFASEMTSSVTQDNLLISQVSPETSTEPAWG